MNTSGMTRRKSLNTLLALALCSSFVLLGPISDAQKTKQTTTDTRDYALAGAPLPTLPVDRQIASALAKVSPQLIRSDIEKLLSFRNRNTISSAETNLPPGTGVIAAAEWIQTQFEGYSKACGNCLEVKVDSFVQEPEPGFNGSKPRVVKPTPLRNVYAILKGTDPAQAKRIYLVTGHYDTRVTDVMNTHDLAPGANDDSSGTAVSLEAARVLSQYKFPATIVFVAVAGEEQGLFGSRHLAQLARQEGWLLEGVLNNDIVGGDTSPGDRLQNKGLVRIFSQGILPSAPIETIKQMLSLGMENDTPSRQLARALLDVDRTYLLSPRKSASTSSIPLHAVMELRLDRYLRGGDHSSFSNEGFPAVRLTEWRENFDHQHQDIRTEKNVEYGDLLKFDDFHYIAQVARFNMATLATLASSPGVPQDVHVVTSNLDNNTTLTWAPPKAAGKSIHYQVLWRETTTTDWQYFAEAGKFPAAAGGLGATLPVSKDNVFFGIRACDDTGHCSQAVAPVPERRR